jgi:hypothetical protein
MGLLCDNRQNRRQVIAVMKEKGPSVFALADGP